MYVRGVASQLASAQIAQAINSGEWVQVGTLDASLVSLYTYNFSAVYEIKLEWGDVEPIIYEIVLIPRNALEIDTTELARLYAKAEALDTSNASYAQREKLREAMEAAKAILDDPTYASLTAVQNGAVYGTPNAPFSWVDRPPGPNRIIGMRWLSGLIYPEYLDFDVDEEVKEFFQLFYHVELTDEQLTQLYDGTL